jgi:hypothetical protein
VRWGNGREMEGRRQALESNIPSGMIVRNFWAVPDTTFDIAPHWREWLGAAAPAVAASR